MPTAHRIGSFGDSMKIVKQSLIDWSIEDSNKKHIGWIKKEIGAVKDYYCVIDNVSFKLAIFSSFKDAKNFAKGLSA
jgi:rRNA processing protein Gar1